MLQGLGGGPTEIRRLIGQGSNTTIDDEVQKTRVEIARAYLMTESFGDLPMAISAHMGKAVREMLGIAWDHYQEQITRIRDSAEARVTAAESARMTAASELESQNALLGELRLKLEHALDTGEALRADVARLSEELRLNSHELERERENGAAERQRHRDELKRETERLDARLMAAEELASEFRAERDNETAKLNAERKALSEASARLQQQQSALDKQLASNSQLVRDNERLLHEMQTKDVALAGLPGLKQVHDAAQAEVKALTIRLEAAGAENTRLSSSLRSQTDAANAAMIEAAELRGALAALKRAKPDTGSDG
jgi:chromosome segregation ATPase